jgi:hypothetical protein
VDATAFDVVLGGYIDAESDGGVEGAELLDALAEPAGVESVAIAGGDDGDEEALAGEE